jgi:hypothetical protein
MKGMALDAIHNDLVSTLGKDIVAYSTVTKYARMLGRSDVRSAQFSDRKEVTLPEAPDVKCSPVDEAMLTTPAEFPFPFPFLFLFPFPFSSVRELSRRICLPRSTMHRHPHWHQYLTQSLRFTVQYLR